MDDSEFIEWVAGHQRQLVRSAYLLTGDLHRAQDLVQEALVKVALRWPRLRSGNPAAYARTIIVHDNASWWRRNSRELTSATPGEAEQVSTHPEAALVVRRALDRLTPRQRAVVVLRHSPTDHNGVVALDREGYATTRYLPIAGTTYDPGIGTFSPGGVTPIAWLDDRTVLLKDATGSRGQDWWLVAWDVETGELTHVSVGPGTLELLGVARDLVAD